MLMLVAGTVWASPCADGVQVKQYRVVVDAGERQANETWVIDAQSVESACPDGLDLPRSLAGAVAQDPFDGQIEVTRRRTLEPRDSGSLSPWTAAAADTRVELRTARGGSLQVFADDTAHITSQVDGKRDIIDVWWPRGADSAPQLIWTDWPNWEDAGNALAVPVRDWTPSTSALGPLGRSLRGAELDSLVSRLDTQLSVQPTDTPGWAEPRPIETILSTGVATPSERGLVLLSMLRGAGYDALPAWFTSADDPAIPRTIPAPHLLDKPAIAVRDRRGDTVYIDPGERAARPPEVPARMRGGRVLAAGRHLTVPLDTAAPRGEVRIDADLTVDETGKIKVYARLSAFGAAEQALRSEVDGLDAMQWPEVVGNWLTPRGTLRDLVVGVEGLDGLEPFSIEIRFTEPQRLGGFGLALLGDVPDLIAPGLAQRMPPGIAIAERLAVTPPEGMVVLTAVRPDHERDPDVLLNRTLTTDTRALTLKSDWRVLTDDDPTERLASFTRPTQVLIFPDADKKGRQATRRLALPESDQRVIEAMLLWRLGLDKKAKRVLGKLHPDLPVAELARLLAKYVPPGDRRPWIALVELVDTDNERIAVIDGLVEIGDQRLGWQLATALTRSEDLETRTRALVQVARLQGPKPDARSDPEGANAWREPLRILEVALKRAGPHQDLVRTDLARAYIRAGRPMEASEVLDRAMDYPDARKQAVYAEFGGVTGVYGIDVLGLVSSALRESPYDPDVHEAAGRALAAIGRRREGVADVLRSAELAGNDASRWIAAAEMAAEYGDLRAAIFAARRASDLAPTQLVPAILLQQLAILAQDEEQIRIGRERSGEELFAVESPTLADLIELAPEYELALLRTHTDEVERDRTLLERRALLHYERHMYEDAALDGALLLDRHNVRKGARYLAAGVLSRVRHQQPLQLVEGHTRASEVREARMDIQLVLGLTPKSEGDRGRILNNARYRPERIAKASTTWPLGMKDFEATPPPGFEDNRILSGVVGVMAWSDPSRQMSVLRTERSVGDLPPPLDQIYQNGPTVLSTARGAAVVRLESGGIPVYAGVTIENGQDVIGLGLTPAAARDAVLYGIGALERPDDPQP
jgi:tetratricopeptide (TPR) repeat protein